MSVANDWSERFGLAMVPLFEHAEPGLQGDHKVMLDGGYGSFALSVEAGRLWEDSSAANWAWSSNLPHHVTVSEQHVAVVRWDKPSPEVLSLRSVETQLDAFYDYLTADRVRSSQGVVEHLLFLFKRMRSLIADARLDDSRSIEGFLGFLTVLVHRARGEGAKLSEGQSEVLDALAPQGLAALLDDAQTTRALIRSLTLFPTLAVRHAGAEIFQEAHFEFLRAPSLDLFGYAGPAESRSVTRGGAHFTPPALARSLVEQALGHVSGLEGRESLTVLDPACGSGAFLHEALRTLRRMGFNGKLELKGRDVSAAAVQMATFVLENAQLDWQPAGGCSVEIAVGDSLEAAMPPSDVVLMNPPFIAWATLGGTQRDQMKRILGSRLEGRGDLSMAFVVSALEALRPAGVLGTLFPASLLNLQAADSWRRSLTENAELKFIASLGDYGLFAHALVQVGAAVLRKPDGAVRDSETIALVTTNSADATGNALRGLRRAGGDHHTFGQSEDWQMFPVPSRLFAERPVWRLTSPRVERALGRLDEAGAVRMGDLFAVRQGIRTGMNEVFVLSEDAFSALPRSERQWFRPAIMNSSISDGRAVKGLWVFYPYDEKGLRLTTEEDLKKEVPTYFERSLSPERARLMARANVKRANRADWWGLSERRASWALDSNPRIVSKYFGAVGGFALDSEASFMIVQGFAWLPKWRDEFSLADEDLVSTRQEDILAAYVALMNSTNFASLLEHFCPVVAGGQFDLSPRYVDAVPIPDLMELAQDPRGGEIVSGLIALGREPAPSDFGWRNYANKLTAAAYGGDFFDELP